VTAVGKDVQLGGLQRVFHAQRTGRRQFIMLSGGDQDRHVEVAHFRQPIPALQIACVQKLVRPLHSHIGRHVPVIKRALDRRRPFVQPADVAVVEQCDCGLIRRVIETAARFMTLHHRHGFAAQRGAQAIKFLDQVRHVAHRVFQDQGFDRVRVIGSVFDTEPAAP
jgi:hypothetical protein